MLKLTFTPHLARNPVNLHHLSNFPTMKNYNDVKFRAASMEVEKSILARPVKLSKSAGARCHNKRSDWWIECKQTHVLVSQKGKSHVVS